ncbi:MAG: hypothetical protein JRD93_20070 [Deltaproteobacteria bacterium]|nr:hypothetical protein [Deltaproteobacteria bacterium]
MARLAGVTVLPDRHICATTSGTERPRPASSGIGYAVLMEAKAVNG